MVLVPKRRLIGVLGGMGPAATIDFLRKVIEVTPAGRDQDHVPIILHGVPQIPDRTAAIHEGSDAPFLPMLAGIRMLERSGAEAIVIPCNTAHYWYDRLARNTDVEILHIVDAVGAALHEHAPDGAVALLATRGTIEARLYPQRLGAQAVAAPDAAVQEAVDGVIGAVKTGHIEAARQGATALAATLAAAGFTAAVLACTELPLAFAGVSTRLAMIDATAALALACVRASLGTGPAHLAAAS